MNIRNILGGLLLATCMTCMNAQQVESTSYGSGARTQANAQKRFQKLGVKQQIVKVEMLENGKWNSKPESARTLTFYENGKVKKEAGSDFSITYTYSPDGRTKTTRYFDADGKQVDETIEISDASGIVRESWRESAYNNQKIVSVTYDVQEGKKFPNPGSDKKYGEYDWTRAVRVLNPENQVLRLGVSGKSNPEVILYTHYAYNEDGDKVSEEMTMGEEETRLAGSEFIYDDEGRLAHIKSFSFVPGESGTTEKKLTGERFYLHSEWGVTDSSVSIGADGKPFNIGVTRRDQEDFILESFTQVGGEIYQQSSWEYDAKGLPIRVIMVNGPEKTETRETFTYTYF